MGASRWTPQHKWVATIGYDTEYEAITAKYSESNCTASSTEWNVTKNILIELVIGQRLNFLLSRLNLDLERYEPPEQPPLPETPIDKAEKERPGLTSARRLRGDTPSSANRRRWKEIQLGASVVMVQPIKRVRLLGVLLKS
jgi:hypothetical protein